jgi:hypothetical protein
MFTIRRVERDVDIIRIIDRGLLCFDKTLDIARIDATPQPVVSVITVRDSWLARKSEQPMSTTDQAIKSHE